MLTQRASKFSLNVWNGCGAAVQHCVMTLNLGVHLSNDKGAAIRHRPHPDTAGREVSGESSLDRYILIGCF